MFDTELLPIDTEEMKPMRDGEAPTYNATEEAEAVAAQVQVRLCLYIVSIRMCVILTYV